MNNLEEIINECCVRHNFYANMYYISDGKSNYYWPVDNSFHRKATCPMGSMVAYFGFREEAEEALNKLKMRREKNPKITLEEIAEGTKFRLPTDNRTWTKCNNKDEYSVYCYTPNEIDIFSRKAYVELL